MKELEKLIDNMRHTEKKLNEYILEDQISNEIYSFNSSEARENFITAYINKNYRNTKLVLDYVKDSKTVRLRSL